MRRLIVSLIFVTFVPAPSEQRTHFSRARDNGWKFDRMTAAAQRVLKAWLTQADRRTLLLPDRLPGGHGWTPEKPNRVYTPHNSGADLYPYLILTAHLTDPDIYNGRMMQMLKNEVLYTATSSGLPADLDLDSGKLGPPSLFGAAEYAKDGLVAVTELLGRTPWYYRMVDLVVAVMQNAAVRSDFGDLPGRDAETNGDVLQVLVRLGLMTGDRRFMEWAERIGDAYVEEVLPGNFDLPCDEWDFDKHTGNGQLRLRDHGNEIIVALSLLYAVEHYQNTARAVRYRPILAKMFDRLLKSATSDGMFHDVIDANTLEPIKKRLSDNWGYVYGAIYAFYQCTGEAEYREAVIRVLKNLPKYRNYDWQESVSDGLADSIESAIYLVAREPVSAAIDWIESEIESMAGRQTSSGFVDRWYCDGNFNRTLLLYAYYKSQGCRPDSWVPGLRLGAVRDGEKLYLSLETVGEAERWRGLIRFDYARHRRNIGFDKNYVRLNEFPEWYVVDENTLYKVSSSPAKNERVVMGSDLIAGIRLSPGNWSVEPIRTAP